MNHQIRQQYIEVELTGTEEEGLEIQRLLPDLYYQKLLPAMDKAFKVFPDDIILSFDRIEIDVGSINLKLLESDFTDSVILEIIKTLRIEIQNDSSGYKSQEGLSQHLKTIPQTLADAFLYFLKTGILPWSFRLTEGKTLENELVDNIINQWNEKDVIYFISRIKEAISDRSSLDRFVNQFSYSFREFALSLISKETAVLSESIYSSDEQTDMNMDELLDFNKSLFESAFKKVSDIINPKTQNISKKAIRDIIKDITSESYNEHEGIYIENAGLVILHPFLSLYFSVLGVISGNEMLQSGRALQLLNHLATGQNKAAEYALALPKILCGLSINSPVSAEKDISENELAESVALLTSVILHWSALKNTSPDALRGTFLSRPGKLFLSDSDNWILQVETSSFDILLGQLPWSISMIRLPWMNKLLTVEWEY